MHYEPEKEPNQSQLQIQQRKIYDYTVVRQIDKGGFGEILEVVSARNIKYAIKLILLGERTSPSEALREASIQYSLEHENILKINEFFKYDNEKYYVFVMDFCEEGNLTAKLKNISSDMIYKYMVGIASGLEYLHHSNIIHRDLKLQNILIKNGIVKIADCGISGFVTYEALKAKGTPCYMSHEALRGKIISPSTDIWSLGIIFIELLLGERIHRLVNSKQPAELKDFPSQQLLNQIKDLKYRQLIKQMLRREPHERLKIADFLFTMKANQTLGVTTEHYFFGKLTKIPVTREDQNGVYQGEIKQGKYHGKGIYKYKNQDIYEGQFYENQMHGYGKMTYLNSAVYEGQFVRGKYDGKGELTYLDGEKKGQKYKGQWSKGQMHGKGTYQSKDKVFVGEFKHNLRQGDGYEVINSKDKIMGNWKNDKKEGHMRYFLSNQDCYEVIYENDQKVKVVKYFFTNRDQYEGDFEKDKLVISGEGKYTYHGGDVYEGQFLNGLKHGMGTYTYKGKGVYTGGWFQGAKSGKGVFTHQDGSRYDGFWEQDNMHGKGRYTYNNSTYYQGEWKHQKRHGKGIKSEINGPTYDGDWFEDQRHGTGTLKYPNGDQITIRWEHNKMNGVGTYQYVNGQTVRKSYVNGRQGPL